MGSVVIPVPDEQLQPSASIDQTQNKPNNKKIQYNQFSLLISIVKEKKFIHGFKVGVALVLVSLIYFLDPVYREIGDDNAMWAVMTVVVIFEFYAGATLAKGLNRGIGTILGGGLGFLVAILAQRVGAFWNSILVGTCMLLLGGIATYWRMKPNFKAKHDYGAMIFILTFSLVALSGLREAQNVIEIARERLLMIVLGFFICIFTSLFVFPIWASDELHDSTVAKFNSLASAIEGCIEELFGLENGEKEEKATTVSFNKCKTVMNSKSKDESLANFAKWEPWHGKFGITYPWESYLKMGETLRELAATVLSLKPCLLKSPNSSQSLQQSIKEPIESMGASLARALTALAESIKKLKKCDPSDLMLSELKLIKLELIQITSGSSFKQFESADTLGIVSLVYLLMEMEEKVEDLAEQVKKLGEVAGFHENSATVKI